MLTFESAESRQQDASTALETIRSRVLVQNEHLAEERATLKKESDRFATERQAVVVCIDVGDLALYDQLRQQKRGVAVATVLDDACSACGAPLTASQQQAARAVNQSQLARCPTCSRILYVD
jgi:predicted  nucleic acid-binding Zn-ribbon protein